MSDTYQKFEVELVEKQLIDVELSVIDVFNVKRNVTDLDDVNVNNFLDGEILILEDGKLVNKSVSVVVDTYAVHNETPTFVNPLPSERFQTEYPYRSETLQVFLNGMKIHDSEITKHSDTQFSYPINIITSDKIEVAYIKK